MTYDDYDPAAHYDRVTEAWGLLLGEDLHYGVFTSADEPLPPATDRLTTRMIEAAQLRAGQRLLDIGCGTGSAACRLVAEHDVEVLGISTSKVGVDAANERARVAGLGGATFEVRDGTDSGLPDAGFDRVWVLEASHLMPDRLKLVAESARVLKPGGRFVLCDIIRRREIPFLELRDRREEFAVLRSAFGAARMDSLDEYVGYAEQEGLQPDDVIDLTSETLPTFDRWQDNVNTHRDRVNEILGPESVDAFERSLVILRDFWRDGTLGYGLVSAVKPA